MRGGDTSARPQPRKNYWAPAHKRRVLPDHQLQLPPSKAPNPSTLPCPSTQLSQPNPNPSPSPPPMTLPGGVFSAALVAEDFPWVRRSCRSSPICPFIC